MNRSANDNQTKRMRPVYVLTLQRHWYGLIFARLDLGSGIRIGLVIYSYCYLLIQEYISSSIPDKDLQKLWQCA